MNSRRLRARRFRGERPLTIRLFDPVVTGSTFTVYKDTEDMLRFWYLPSRYRVAGFQSKYEFLARLERNGGAGAAYYDFECWTVSADEEEISAALDVLRKRYGRQSELVNYWQQPSGQPILRPITELPYLEVSCQYAHSSHFSVSCRFVVPESVEPGLAKFIQTDSLGWTGEVLLDLEHAEVVAEWHVSSADYSQALMWHFYRLEPPHNPEHPSPGPIHRWEIFDAAGQPGTLYQEVERLIAKNELKIATRGRSISSARRVVIGCEALIKARIFIRNIHDQIIRLNRWGKFEEYESVNVPGCESEPRTKRIGLGIALSGIPYWCFEGYDTTARGEKR